MGKSKVRTVMFEGDKITTTVTSSGEAVEGWLDEIYSVHRRRLHKLIVGSASAAAASSIYADYIPDALDEFLGDPRYRFVGVGVQDDAVRLSRDYDLEVENTVDLGELVADNIDPDLRKAGLKAIASAVMGATVDKPQRVRTGCWDAYELSDEQIKYACIDAFVSFEVGRKLLTGDY
ncbi:unnamed protein product [Urochloa decumbens]|uniref:3'-5' exonuclease domain-containing protein n=1 Tax=Urochloa decumbens TaxID=240449 RepID=A0ABC9A8F1_9POAL